MAAILGVIEIVFARASFYGDVLKKLLNKLEKKIKYQ
jgi:hypothetical protein